MAAKHRTSDSRGYGPAAGRQLRIVGPRSNCRARASTLNQRVIRSGQSSWPSLRSGSGELSVSVACAFGEQVFQVYSGTGDDTAALLLPSLQNKDLICCAIVHAVLGV